MSGNSKKRAAANARAMHQRVGKTIGRGSAPSRKLHQPDRPLSQGDIALRQVLQGLPTAMGELLTARFTKTHGEAHHVDPIVVRVSMFKAMRELRGELLNRLLDVRNATTPIEGINPITVLTVTSADLALLEWAIRSLQ